MADYFGSRFKERVFFAKKAVELGPKNLYALRTLAWAYWISGDLENAASVYGRLKRADVKSYQDVMQKNPDLKGLSVSDLPESLSRGVA